MKTFDCHSQIIPKTVFTCLDKIEIRSFTLSAWSSGYRHHSDLKTNGVKSIKLVLHLLSIIQGIVMPDIVHLILVMKSMGMSLNDLNSIGNNLWVRLTLLVKTKICLVENVGLLGNEGCLRHALLLVTLRET